MMDETDQTISQIVAEVAAAMRDAAVDYGPEAADLALLAYQVDAIKALLLIPVASASIWGLWKAWGVLLRVSEGWVVPHSYGDDTFGRTIARVFGGVAAGGVALMLAIGGVNRLIDIPLWLAAFGNPELLIATRALQAAGLL